MYFVIIIPYNDIITIRRTLDLFVRKTFTIMKIHKQHFTLICSVLIAMLLFLMFDSETAKAEVDLTVLPEVKEESESFSELQVDEDITATIFEEETVINPTEESSEVLPENLSSEDDIANSFPEMNENLIEPVPEESQDFPVEDFVIEPEIDSEETPAEIVEPSLEPDSSEEILMEELPAEPSDQLIEKEDIEADLEQEVIDTDLELTKEEPNYEIRPIDNNLYFVNTETGEVRKDNAWIDYKGYHIFPNKEGILYRNQFITFGPAYKHYMDSEGKAARGLKQVGNNLYYFDESTDEPLKRGVMRKDNKWVKPNGSTESVFVNDKGLVYRNQWITFGSEEAYYMGNDGYKVKGRVIARGNNLHFTDPITGNVRKDNSWIDYGEHRIFPNNEGILYRNQFITFGPDVAYYMNNSGYRAIGLFVDIKGNQYYADSTVGSSYGRIIRNNSSGYITIKGTKYYFSSDGSGKLRRGRIVYLDPGHGGRDSGAYYGGIREETLNLKISNLIKAGMEELGYEVIMSRTKDIYIDLLERARDANNKDPDIFVSVHNNAMPNDSRVNGIMTYYYKYYPEWQPVINPEMHNDPTRIEQSRQLADAIQKSLIAATGARDLGLRRNTFAVLRETKMPAVLLELGFMSNPTELSKLNTTSYQTTLANAVVKGIHNHFTQ